MTPDDVLRALEDCGALLSGHFELSSGKHSDRYVQKQLVFTRPRLTMRLAEAVVEKVPRGSFDVVVAPALGAIAWGFAVAHAADVRFVFTERDDGAMTIRRAQSISSADRVLVVEDVMTTGGSAQEVIEVVTAAGATVAGVVVLVDRTVIAPSFDLTSLVRLDVRAWEPGECPLCAAGEPLDSPGSRHLARG